jgi:hypothetical protein
LLFLNRLPILLQHTAYDIGSIPRIIIPHADNLVNGTVSSMLIPRTSQGPANRELIANHKD